MKDSTANSKSKKGCSSGPSPESQQFFMTSSPGKEANAHSTSSFAKVLAAADASQLPEGVPGAGILRSATPSVSIEPPLKSARTEDLGADALPQQGSGGKTPPGTSDEKYVKMAETMQAQMDRSTEIQMQVVRMMAHMTQQLTSQIIYLDDCCQNNRLVASTHQEDFA